MPEWLNMLLTALGGLGVGGYAVHRKLKSDSGNDKLDTKSQQLIDNMASQLEYERNSNRHLGEVIDRLAKERNEAVQNVGRMEGQVQALEHQVKYLSNEIQKLELINQTLSGQIQSLREEMTNMSRQVAVALKSP